MAAGVPVVVVPLFADQFDNGRRIAEAGAGVMVEVEPDSSGARRVIGEEDAPRIAEGIEAVLGGNSYGRRARRLAQEMAATPTVDEVLESLLTGGIKGSR